MRNAPKQSSSSSGQSADATNGDSHNFTSGEIKDLQKSLLSWYDEKKRTLPWRTIAKEEEDHNKRAYAVWVSEIMLQQTQVATVISYYNRWMEKWPTLEQLAKATLEEVNEMWSGLGYYSRGRRLHEGAQKVVSDLGGDMPRSAEALLKQLPGVGRYTAGAIASIAYNQPAGLVDDTPGDYNQSLMELGATVCTPKAPVCTQCPVQHLCMAYSQVQRHKEENAAKLTTKSEKNGKARTVCDIECAADSCKLCLSSGSLWDVSQGVMNYPRKAKKKAAREERTAVCILHRQIEGVTEYMMVQRPSTGLLANLWEFPSVIVGADDTEKQCRTAMGDFLSETFGVAGDLISERSNVGQVVHLFSHIHQTYVVESIRMDISDIVSERVTRWLCKQDMATAAMPTAMKKVFKAFEELQQKDSRLKPSRGDKRKRVHSGPTDGKKQFGLTAFFKPKPK